MLVTESDSTKADSNREQSLATFGLLGASFALLLTILTLDSLDVPLRVAATALTIALPMLSLDAWSITQFSFEQRLKLAGPTLIAMLGGYLSAMTALTAAFWHVGWYYGVAFDVLCVATLVLGTHINLRAEREARKSIR